MGDQSEMSKIETRIDLTSFEDESIWEEKIRTWVKPLQDQRFSKEKMLPQIINKVPQRLRILEGEKNYNPQLISLGPYHHKKDDTLKLGRNFKYKILEKFISGCHINVNGMYKKIFKLVKFARGFYEQGSTEEYGDDEFAAMMLLDGCFILHTLENHSIPLEWMVEMLILHEEDGELGWEILYQDMFLLENQLPFPILQELMSFKHDKETWEKILNRSFSFIFFGNHYPLDPKLIIFDEKGSQLVHILEIVHQLFCYNHDQDVLFLRKQIKGIDQDQAEDLCLNAYPTYSVMELKAKGIHFRPKRHKSMNNFYSNITFESCWSYGQIKVPPLIIRPLTKSIFLNLLAYENSPHAPLKGLYITPYVSFMRSLIHSVEDVKELKSKGVMLNYFASDEEVVKMFKDMDFEPRNYVMFLRVLAGIKGHIDSKGKTWIAELISEYFSSPWTLTAFLASVILLVLTFLQTYYTISPVIRHKH